MRTFTPSFTSNGGIRRAMLKKAQEICAAASFKTKYACPEDMILKLESSPSTHTSGKEDSNVVLMRRVSALTVSGSRLSMAPEYTPE